MTRPRLSVTLVVRNEEAHLPDCLASVAWADEIVVVDSDSTDRTGTLCRAAGVRYFQGDFVGILDKKRFAHAQATGEWVLNLDADERVTPALRAEIEAALANGRAAGFRVRRRSFYLGRWIDHGEWNPDRVLRLFRRERTRWEGTDPHAHAVVDGPLGELRGPLVHYVYRDFSHQMETVRRYAALAARQMHAEGRRAGLAALLVRPWLRFLKTYVWKRGFLDGVPGLAIAYSSLYYDCAKFLLLWELGRAGGRQKSEVGSRKSAV